MEPETLTTNHNPSSTQRLLAAVVPVFLIAISYVDPGKWAAAVEGGARFGPDLVLLVFIFNCVAVLCQYVSARIAIATGKDLSQICSEEYDEMTCIFLGVQAEVSIIALDLTMVLGSAYGLNAVFGIDLFNCVFLTGIDSILFSLLAVLLENRKANFPCIYFSCFILLTYALGVLLSQPESSLSMGSVFTKLNGESAYALMSLLGANIMPHNFYLHSSIVQQDQGAINVPKRALCHDHFFATLCTFSVLFLVNCVLMNLAASVYYSTGLVSLTFQDALSLLDQVYRSSLAPSALILIIFFSNQIIALTWNLGRQVIIQDFFKMDIPGWLHRATVRIIAIIPALYCVWNSGAEGIFQLLIFTQVVVALLLPSSVIPLFRVASSRSIMGPYKVSQLVEFFAMISLIGMLGLKIIFVVEMLFGNNDWVSNLKWNIGGSVPTPYLILLMVAFASLCWMLWLAAIPLKSASLRVDTQAFQLEIKQSMLEPSLEEVRDEVSESQYHVDKARERQEPVSSVEKSLGGHQYLSAPNTDINLPETILDSVGDLDLMTIEENKSDITFSVPSESHSDLSTTINKTAMDKPVCSEGLEAESLDASTMGAESTETVEKTLRIEGDVQNEKDDEGDPWEREESTKDVTESSISLTSDGPGSYRSLSGKGDDVGSGTGSLSRLAGLGRAARRQLTGILDEFWGQLFDFHGQATQEAKSKKLDVLLGIDSKIDPKPNFVPIKLESISKESTGSSSFGGRGSDSFRTSNLYSPSKPHIGQSGMMSSLGIPQGSSMLGNPMQLFDAYARNSSLNAPELSERRYYSVHVPASSEGYDQQPATIHGYDIAYLSRIAKEKGADYLNGPMESLTQKSSSLVKPNYIDSFARPSGQRLQGGARMLRPPGFHNVPISRNTSLKSEKPFHDVTAPEPADYTSNAGSAKKFYSLPDISGLYVPPKNASFSNKISELDIALGLGYGQPNNRPAHEQTFSSVSSLTSTGLGSEELSPSKVCRDAFSLQFGSGSVASSLWSKQPYEQFGVADKSHPRTQEIASIVDLEAKLLQTFRSCIMKLLKLEGSDWLFRQNDGADEDLIDRVAAREKFLYEIETRASDRKFGSAIRPDETDYTKSLMLVSHCGEECVYRADLVISFGVWCIHRILELSLMESRPELWGKYTYVLNRLQGIIDPAFSKPRSPMVPCFCLQLPIERPLRSSPPSVSNGNIPIPVKQNRGKLTTAAMLLDVIKDVEIAISCRKGRTGTAAGDVAFPKGKENLASVLKRYKRRLSNKPVGSQERKIPSSASQSL